MMQKELTAKQKEMLAVHSTVYDIVERNYTEAVGQNGRAAATGGKTVQTMPLYSKRLTFYINTCHPGVFDLQDTLEADNMEFLQMAYYSLFGTLPEKDILERWQAKAELSDWDFRREVLEALMQSPEIAVKEIVIRNDIYTAGTQAGSRQRQSLKQKILFGGYQLSRKLPNSIKTPLKKIAMKILMK